MTQPPIPEGETLEQAIEKFCSIMGHNNPSARKAFIAGAEWQKAQAGGEWISVETALPESDYRWRRILVNGRHHIQPHMYENGKWFEYGQSNEAAGVSHWQEFTEPPTPQ